MFQRFIILMVFICVTLSACATTPPMVKEDESYKDVEKAIETVAEAMSGQDLTEEEMRGLSQQIRKDKEAQTAIQSISEAVDKNQARVKYSPATGKRYAPHMEVDPETGVQLEWVEE